MWLSQYVVLNGVVAAGFAQGGVGGCAGRPSCGDRGVVTGMQRSWQVLMFTAVMAATAAAAYAQQAPSQAPKPAQIDRNGVLILIRSTLLALDQANKTGNYTVLRDIGAPGFQTNTAARLGEIFAKLRNDNLDLSGVAVIDPQLSLLPQIEANGLMRMSGFFPSVPSQVNFELMYAPVSGQWRLFGISVNIGQSGPAAPAAEVKPGNKQSPPAGAAKSAPTQKQSPADGAKQ
jgi:hypothetical protein